VSRSRFFSALILILPQALPDFDFDVDLHGPLCKKSEAHITPAGLNAVCTFIGGMGAVKEDAKSGDLDQKVCVNALLAVPSCAEPGFAVVLRLG
jgi:hypothetical protein